MCRSVSIPTYDALARGSWVDVPGFDDAIEAQDRVEEASGGESRDRHCARVRLMSYIRERALHRGGGNPVRDERDETRAVCRSRRVGARRLPRAGARTGENEANLVRFLGPAAPAAAVSTVLIEDAGRAATRGSFSSLRRQGTPHPTPRPSTGVPAHGHTARRLMPSLFARRRALRSPSTDPRPASCARSVRSSSRVYPRWQRYCRRPGRVSSLPRRRVRMSSTWRRAGRRSGGGRTSSVCRHRPRAETRRVARGPVHD